MSLIIQIRNKNVLKASAAGEQAVSMLYQACYEQGDVISLQVSEPCFLMVSLEDSLAPAYLYVTGEYQLPIPFGKDRVSYSPKCFAFDQHFLAVRTATKEEIATRKNLCQNVYDHHSNATAFPHSFANVETRNEAVFASRNAIDGVYAAGGHGEYPYQSWGVNQQADAEITIAFGRAVNLDCVGITLRSDFPHDNWWHHATLRFSDGSCETIALEKSAAPQRFAISKQQITSVTLCEMKKDETDPSPFPALMQLEAFGVESE